LLRVVPTSQSGFAVGFGAESIAVVAAEALVARIVVANKHVNTIEVNAFFMLFSLSFV